MADWQREHWRRLVAERQNVAGNLAAHRGQMQADIPMTRLIASAIANESARLAAIDAELAKMDLPTASTAVDMDVTTGEVHIHPGGHGTVDPMAARRALERRLMPI